MSDIKIKSSEKYASVDYWNGRYTNEVEYDWLGDYNMFKDIIARHVSKSDKVLMVGCGNSNLSQQMYLDGYTQICSSDISETCIANQTKIFPHLSWTVADVTNLSKDFEEGSFDVVIEKSTLDALLGGEKSPWHPSEQAQWIEI
jgi:2-polyprenyl-3-methyl-5-hydroxy-6-metoxy-1,4-benzoquinol methylase